MFSMHIPWVPSITLLKEAPRKSPGNTQEHPRKPPGSPQEAPGIFRLLSHYYYFSEDPQRRPYGLWRLIFVTVLMVPLYVHCKFLEDVSLNFTVSYRK